MKRHSDEASQSGALGVMTSIGEMKIDGGDLVVSLPEGNADLPLLLSDYHLVIQPNGGLDDPNAGIGTGPYKVATFRSEGRRVGKEGFSKWRYRWEPDS